MEPVGSGVGSEFDVSSQRHLGAVADLDLAIGHGLGEVEALGELAAEIA